MLSTKYIVSVTLITLSLHGMDDALAQDNEETVKKILQLLEPRTIGNEIENLAEVDRGETNTTADRQVESHINPQLLAQRERRRKCIKFWCCLGDK